MYFIKYLWQRIETELKKAPADTLSVFIFSFYTVPIILYNRCALHYLNTYANDDNFIQWYQSKKYCNFIFVFLYEIYFLLAHCHFKCNPKNPEWYQIKQEQAIYCERFSLNISNKPCNKGLKYCKFERKRNRAKDIIKKGNSRR